MRERAGIETIDDPALHPHATPTATRRSPSPTSRSAEADVIGGVGGGDDLQRAWFMEERLGIAARCVGAMWRLLDETSEWAMRARAGRQPDPRLPGRLLPARRLGRRRRRRAAADAHRRRARRRRRRPEARPQQGLDGEAVHERGRLALRRPLRAGVRRPRLPALERRRAASCASSGSTGSGRAPARSSA